jgi:hypothetical protein
VFVQTDSWFLYIKEWKIVGEPMISPTEVRERDFYAPNSVDLDPDEMRIIACGTGMPTPRPAQAASLFTYSNI